MDWFVGKEVVVERLGVQIPQGLLFHQKHNGWNQGRSEASGESCWNYYERSVCVCVCGAGGGQETENRGRLETETFVHADSYILHYLILFSLLAGLEEPAYQ